ncbi:PAS domain-containing protein [Sediminispirochaeta bajacaliforniensis]|uniref:PAS domain-containing protein n=1 Tax=Sediminispirochaeta bajacaliforniensis TaxID=148 RepID=UPI00037A6231|nr:PAS domain S-box protein [Sediminispirochaeta bajacaliforniensis]
MGSNEKDTVDLDVYKKVFRTTAYALILVDAKGCVMDVNNSFLQLWKFNNPCDVIGRHASFLLKEKQTDEEIKTVIKEGSNWSGKLTAVDNDNSVFEVFASVSIIRDNQKRIRYALGTIVDINEQQETLYHLSKRQEHYHFLTEAIHDAYWLINFEGEIVDCNMNACRMLHYSREELLHKRIAEIDAIEGQKIMDFFLQGMVSQETRNLKTRHRTKEGELIDVDVRCMYWKSRNQFIGFIRNVTQHEQLSEELRHTSKNLESLNQTLSTFMNKTHSKYDDQKYTVSNTMYKVILPMIKQLNELNAANQIKTVDIIKQCFESMQVVPIELLEKLSPNELKISHLITQGYTSKEIGSIMNLSERTVENYRQAIRMKLCIKNKSINLRKVLRKYYLP